MFCYNNYRSMSVDEKHKPVNEGAFENWCKKHITVMLQPYINNPDYQDLKQDAWLIAYEFLRYCQSNKSAVNYNICRNRIIDKLNRCNRQYITGGITYTGQTDIIMEDDVENVASEQLQDMQGAHIADMLIKLIKYVEYLEYIIGHPELTKTSND